MKFKRLEDVLKSKRMCVITIILDFFSNKMAVFGKGMGVRHKAMGFCQMEWVLG